MFHPTEIRVVGILEAIRKRGLWRCERNRDSTNPHYPKRTSGHLHADKSKRARPSGRKGFFVEVKDKPDFYIFYDGGGNAQLEAGVRAKPYTGSRRESQFPTATFALKSFFGLLLGGCASAAWTLHRAHLCQRAVRSYFEDLECGLHGSLLQSTSHRHPTGCYSVSMHFRFHDANGEVSPAKSIS
jgi:hypothetical protein